MPTVPDTCACQQARQKPCTAVENAVIGVLSDQVIATSDRLTRSEAKWMTLYRCRNCGMLWVEACYSSGHMDLYYLFPAPLTANPTRWLHEQAAELPARAPQNTASGHEGSE